LALAAVVLNKKPASPWGKTLERAVSLSPTIFPIAFAAITGRFFRIVGLFLAQRGARLGTLERLIGSQSLFAALERQFRLRGSYILGLSIILTWALSPLGGQSALRLLNTKPRFSTTNTTINYLPIEASYQTYLSTESGLQSNWPLFSSLYMTALTTARPLNDSTEDLFGNVRIPGLDVAGLNGNWATIDYSSQVDYTSLLGIAITGLPETGNATFSIRSRYFEIACSDLTYLTSTFNFFPGTGNATSGSGLSFAIEPVFRGDTPQLNFTLTSLSSAALTAGTSASCSLQSRDVESQIACSERQCRVNALRLSPVPASTWWKSEPNGPGNALTYLPYATVGSVHHGSVMGSSLTEQFLSSPSSDFQPNKFVNLSLTPIRDFEKRLEVVFNTFWQSTYWTDALAGNTSAGLHAGQWNSTTADTSQVHGLEYIPSGIFATLLVLISLFLLAEAVLGAVLIRLTIAPDILGYVASCARDSVFFEGAGGGSG
ncbi:hypothetical protein LSUE1_G010265, partial [Lachnellula suecica]